MKLGRILIVLIVLGSVGYGVWREFIYTPPEGSEQAARGGRGGRRRGAAGDPIPVLITTATTTDVPVYLDALGTVQAFNTVTVKAMIDGPLVEVRFKEGQDVRTGDVLAKIDARPYQAALDQAVAKKAQDDATLANARVDLVRYQKLAATAYTSAQTSDTQKSTVAQTEALVRQDQAQIDTARTNLSYTTISSPLDGRTGIRQVDQGNIVHASDTTPLTVITQLQPISVVFTLPQQTLPAVASAMRDGAPEVLALPQGVANDGKTVLDRGKVAVLDNTVDQSTGTIKLKATFPNPNLALWPGGFINVRLLVDTQRQVVSIPPSAVQRGPQGTFVFLLKDDTDVIRKVVQVGHEDESVSIITAGLQAGDRVVLDGASRLTDGSKIKIQTPGEPAETERPERRRRAPGQGRQRASTQ
ncbi:efflux RND transporter periplasmic adaptor subunit [Acidisphaera sp. L21]|uniref:efflux RND transporter periplasmic adaptor subunit n=1 Tax=Acidisphaera sp. L21 TaxID=1641851 RepID=UPI00131C303F|nr:efflux RND transporter periplasmic adaptor subunit [Acidisphaera sp. L21]